MGSQVTNNGFYLHIFLKYQSLTSRVQFKTKKMSLETMFLRDCRLFVLRIIQTDPFVNSCKYPAHFRRSGTINSAIHKAAGRRQERPQRPFPYSWLQGFSVIVPGKAGNGSAGCFVNSAVTALFTKPSYNLPPYRTVSGGHSCHQLPLKANGHFSVPQESYQANQWNGHEP